MAGDDLNRLPTLAGSTGTQGRPNQLLRYGHDEKLGETPAEVVALLTNAPESFEADFKAQVKEVRRLNEDGEELPPEIQAILDSGLPAFETFIEVVSHTTLRP